MARLTAARGKWGRVGQLFQAQKMTSVPRAGRAPHATTQGGGGSGHPSWLCPTRTAVPRANPKTEGKGQLGPGGLGPGCLHAAL